MDERMPGPAPKPQLVRMREGDLSKGHAQSRVNPDHPVALPEKPSSLSAEAGEVWDDYLRFAAPGLLRLVHAQALAQLCEDKVLERRLREGIAGRERVMIRSALARAQQSEEMGCSQSVDDLLPGGPLAVMASDEDGKRIFGVLNQVVLRVQRQEQQFGLTPQGATRVDIGSSGEKPGNFEDELCG